MTNQVNKSTSVFEPIFVVHRLKSVMVVVCCNIPSVNTWTMIYSISSYSHSFRSP